MGNISNFSAETVLPQHATLMRHCYVSCQSYASQGKTYKARAYTAFFLSTVPLTTAKYLIQAPLCALWDFVHLRNGFPILGFKVAEAVHCLVFGLLQTAYLLTNNRDHIANVQAKQSEIQKLQDEKLRLAQQIALLDVQQKEKQTRIQSLQDEKQRVEQQIELLNGQQKEHQSTIQDLQNAKGSLEQQIGELREIVPVQTSKVDLERQIQLLNNRKITLESELQQLKESVERDLRAKQELHARELQRMEDEYRSKIDKMASDAFKRIQDQLQSRANNPDGPPPEASPPGSPPRAASPGREEAAGYMQFITGALGFAISPITRIVGNWCVDGDAPWKTHRYSLYLKHFDTFEQFRNQLIKDFRDHPNKKIKDIVAKFNKAHKALVDLKSKNFDPRAFYKKFVELLRPGTEAFFQNIEDVPQNFRDFVLKNLDKRFSDNHINTFYSKLTFWMAKEGQKATQPVGLSLSEKLKWVHEGIALAPSTLKAPPADIAAAKLKAIRAGYDPLGESNQPSIIGTAKYRGPEGRTKEVTIMRTPVPVCGRTSLSNWGDQYYELGDTALASEYLAHCHALMAEGKKMLVILHLDPKYLDELGRPSKAKYSDYITHPSTALKVREAQWINLFRKLGKQFPEHIKVCLFPLDGEWLDELNKENSLYSHTVFMDLLKQEFKNPNSFLKLPSFVESLDKVDLEEQKLIDQVIDEVWNTYFNTEEDRREFMTAEKRRAFLMLFYSRLAEHLRIKHDIDFEQRNCKDAVDRTEAIAGVHTAEAANRLGRLRNPAVQDLVIGQTEGPAMTYVKRGVLNSRENFLMSGFRYLEKFPEQKVPSIQGYDLVDFDFHEDPTQTLPGESPGQSRSSSPSLSPPIVAS